MGVKVVPFILFALAGECLSLTLHQKQVDDVLEKMYHKISEIDEKLSKIENRVTELENSQTKPKENKPTNLEDAMRNLHHSYRSMNEVGDKECADKECGYQCGTSDELLKFCQFDGSCKPSVPRCQKPYRNMVGDKECADKECGEVCATNQGMLQVMRYCQPDGSCKSSLPSCGSYRSLVGDKDCADKECGEVCATIVPPLKFLSQGMLQVIRHCQPDGSCKSSVPSCSSSYRSLSQEDLPDQCTTYKTLTDSSRLIERRSGAGDVFSGTPGEPIKPQPEEKMFDRSGDPKQRPDWQGEGWYRYNPGGKTGIRMAFTHEVTKFDICGTSTGGAMELGPIPEVVGETKNAKVDFGYIPPFISRQDIKVTNCGKFFVYYLPDAKPDGGYCFVKVPEKWFEENNKKT